MEIPIPSGLGQEGDSFDLSLSAETVDPPVATPDAGAETSLSTLPPVPVGEVGQAASGTPWKAEDRSFPGSDIAITILLFREDGHPDGRLVQIVVKDFTDVLATKTFRARQLTRESELDALQQDGLNDVVQQFWLLLEERRKKAAQEAAKQKSAPAQVSAAAVSTPAQSPAPAASVSAPVSVTRPVPPKKPASTQQFEFF